MEEKDTKKGSKTVISQEGNEDRQEEVMGVIKGNM